MRFHLRLVPGGLRDEDGGMTQLGFVLDQRKCIGCHACTVACKVEHGVELGVFRTWVKYVEEGTFPDSRRSFSVMRCNQCTDAPCVEICPVKALYKREDGIVDFDPDRCIGCKACMNACPYDALYVEPESGTAAKCNFCAHRVDDGLQPACEVVCPTNAIVSGDVDDPDSPIRKLIDVIPSTVRAPEQGTGPNVFYLGANEASLDPLAVSGDAYLYSEMPESQAEKLAPLAEEATARAMHDVAHPAPWGWRVSSYFLTKGVAAGAMMLAFGGAVSGLVALAGIAATGAFLVTDLKRPERFYRLFVMPQWRSWLALGAQCINVAALVALAYTVCAALGADGARDVLRWAMVPAGAALAGYTALLFGQCEGRDLWQSRWLLPHTLVNALLAGAAAFAVLGEGPVRVWLAAAAVASAAIALADAFGRHPTGQARQAARNLIALDGFRAGVALIAVSAPLAFAFAPAAGVLALAGLWLYEHAWVRAGQSVPLS
jgi:Fe-S-cluster-containing dehydrogenase component/formate-dependent nitrite reductase membrane component NrfD